LFPVSESKQKNCTNILTGPIEILQMKAFSTDGRQLEATEDFVHLSKALPAQANTNINQ